jgi:tRNA threonylcarbamoyladenosine biosynthesis protein TsaB
VKRLIIDTATRACSVALFDGDVLVDARHEVIGRGHAERLVPMIAELPNQGRAEAIHVNVGPGSFTGIRVGVSAARALAVAWGAECHGYGNLALIAAIARQQCGSASDIDVAIPGGHGELFFQTYHANGSAAADPQSLPPADAASISKASIIAGAAAAELTKLRGDGAALDIDPDARHWLLLANTHPIAPSPLYVRDADAKLPGGITP